MVGKNQRLKGRMRAGLLALAGAAPAAVFAICGHGQDGTDYCGPELIRQLYITKMGTGDVRPTTPLTPLPSGFACAPVSGTWFILDPAAPNFKQLYAALLSARVSGAPVTLVTDPTKHDCTISYIEL